MSDAPTQPICPRCGAAMRLARLWPAAFGRPELRSYACTQCREAVTVENPEAAQRAAVSRTAR